MIESVAALLLFTAVIGNERLVLACEGPSLIEAPCRIGTDRRSDGQPVRFTAPGTRYRYPHLLKRGLEKALAGELQQFQYSAADISVLRSLDVDNCNPADQSDGMTGDLVQLCVTRDPASVVLFLRGLCDRCDFEPVVFRKEASK